MSLLLCELHWLRVPQPFEFRFAVIVYRCLDDIMVHHHCIVVYLTDGLQFVVNTSSRSGLISASTVLLQVRRSKHSTIGDWDFPSMPQRFGTLYRRRLRLYAIFCSEESCIWMFQWLHFDEHHWTSTKTWKRPGNLLGRLLAFITVVGLLGNFNNIIIITPIIYRHASGSQENLDCLT